MKKITGFILILCAFATCQDSPQSPNDRSQSLRNIGSLISNEEASRWRSRDEKTSSRLRQQSSPTISKSSLQQVVNAMTDYDGVYFHYGLEGDKHHVLLIPYKDGQSLWSTTLVIDANSNSKVDVTTASLWAGSYMSENVDGPWSHFFGRHVFETILSNNSFEQMEIAPATNDSGLAQLLLYATYHSSTTNGRIQETVEVYDHSHQCPPYCP